MSQAQNLLAHLSLCWWNCNEASPACQKVASLEWISKEKIYSAVLSGFSSLNKKLFSFQCDLTLNLERFSVVAVLCLCNTGGRKGGQFRLWVQDGNAWSLALRLCLSPGSLSRIPAPAPAPRQRGCRADEPGAAQPLAEPVGDKCPKPSGLTTHFSSLIRPIVSWSLTLIPTRGHHLLLRGWWLAKNEGLKLIKYS